MNAYQELGARIGSLEVERALLIEQNAQLQARIAELEANHVEHEQNT